MADILALDLEVMRNQGNNCIGNYNSKDIFFFFSFSVSSYHHKSLILVKRY